MFNEDRPPLRSALRTTSPPFDGGEEMRELTTPGALPLPPERGEVAPRSGDGVGEGLSKSRSRRKPGATGRARNLRQRDNQAEALLWLELKRRQLGGYKFTRQLPIGPYFADFACRDKWLVVEIDGSQHADSADDRRRDDFMRSHGYSTLRFWNTDVLKHRTSVCETILAALDGRLAENVSAFDLRFVHASPPRSPSTRQPVSGNRRLIQFPHKRTQLYEISR
jgi:very-short-patch-repair endonuclease